MAEENDSVTQLKSTVHYCLYFKGKDPSCSTCCLNNHDLCQSMRSCLGKWNSTMLRNFGWKLTFDDRQDILNDTFAEILKKIEGLRSPRAFASWAGTKFRSHLSSHLLQMNRTGNVSLKIQFPPDNIASICGSLEGKFGWDPQDSRIELLAYPLKYPVVTKAASMATFSNDANGSKKISWERLLEKIYRLSTTASTGEIEDESTTEDGQDSGLEATLQEDPGMLLVFRKSTNKTAQGCADLFKNLLENDKDTRKTANEMGLTTAAVRKRLSRCYQLYRERLVSILRQMCGKQAERCYRLLQAVFFDFRSTLDGKPQAAELIEKYAEKYEIPVDYLDREIRSCRLMAVQYLEENHHA